MRPDSEAAVPAEMGATDAVNHPGHYTQARAECIDIIEDLKLPYHLACAMKYIWRHRDKAKPIEDLKKARWYIDRWIKLKEAEENQR
jgi:hypothetical protein